MAMEVTQVLPGQNGSRRPEAPILQTREKTQAAISEFIKENVTTPEEVRRTVQQLRRVSQAFDKRLSFSYNEELGQMIVKVIDSSTDKVIKVLPPDELQRVHLRIREAIGLLLDESV